MRCFVAIDVSDDLKPAIINLQKKLPLGVSVIPPESLHFTLKFLGDTEPKGVAEKLAFLGQRKPFDIRLGGIGAFPSEKYVRVVWVGAESSGLVKIQKEIEGALGACEEGFVPHVTIARVKRPAELAGFLDASRSVQIGTMLADRIKLKRSDLFPSGPVYTDIGEFKLA